MNMGTPNLILQQVSSCGTGAGTGFRFRRNYFKAANRGGLIVEHFEDPIDFAELHDILDALREFHEFQLAAASRSGSVSSHQFTQTTGIDVIDFRHVEQDILLASLERVGDELTELPGSWAERDGTGEIDDQDVPHFPVKVFEGHAPTVAPTVCCCQHSARMKLPRRARSSVG